MKIYQQSATQ